MKKEALPYNGIVCLGREFSQPEISRMFKIPKSSLNRYCKEFGIKCVDPGERTEKFIRDNYKSMPIDAVAKALDKHKYYIYNVYKRLGLKPLGYTKHIGKEAMSAKIKRTVGDKPKKVPEIVKKPVIVIAKPAPKKKGRSQKERTNIISVGQVFGAMNRSNINILETL